MQLSFKAMNPKPIMNMSYVAIQWLWNVRYPHMWQTLSLLIYGWTQRIETIIRALMKKLVLRKHSLNAKQKIFRLFRCVFYTYYPISQPIVYFICLFHYFGYSVLFSFSRASVLSNTCDRWICFTWQLCDTQVSGAIFCRRFYNRRIVGGWG